MYLDNSAINASTFLRILSLKFAHSSRSFLFGFVTQISYFRHYFGYDIKFLLFGLFHVMLFLRIVVWMGPGQNCTKTKLHEGTKLHEDKIARRVKFARRRFCTKTNLHEGTKLHKENLH